MVIVPGLHDIRLFGFVQFLSEIYSVVFSCMVACCRIMMNFSSLWHRGEAMYISLTDFK